MKVYFKQFWRQPIFWLSLIIIVGLFLRSYMAAERMIYGHDGDLFSWIVKDMVIDHHPRLIGQLTSSPGIFIGGLWYYLLVPFFMLANMSPLGTLWLPLIIGSLTTISFYWVFKQICNVKAGLIAATLQSFLISRVLYDRWIVPTMTTSLWEIWFLWVLVALVRGQYQWLPLLGVLIGLIWHINFSLATTMLAVPVAILVARKWPTIKQIGLTIVATVVTSLPLILFEVRNGFSQTQSFIQALTMSQGGQKGWPKLISVIYQSSNNWLDLWTYPWRGEPTLNLILFGLGLGILIILIFVKQPNRQLYLPLLAWFVGLIGYFSISSKIVAEYYLLSLNLVLLVGIIYFLSKLPSRVLIILGILLAIFSSYFMIYKFHHNGLGYLDKKAVIDFIKQDAITKDYPCVGLSFITTPGNELGFRYVTYQAGLQTNKPSLNIPVYTIVMPPTLVNNQIDRQFGAYGLIDPKPNDQPFQCQSEDTNLTESMFGFVN